MPRFYLHLWEDGCLFEDEGGAELSDPNAAVLIAKRTLGEMICDDIRNDRQLGGRCIVIADKCGTTVAAVRAPEIQLEVQSAS